MLRRARKGWAGGRERSPVSHLYGREGALYVEEISISIFKVRATLVLIAEYRGGNGAPDSPAALTITL